MHRSTETKTIWGVCLRAAQHGAALTLDSVDGQEPAPAPSHQLWTPRFVCFTERFCIFSCLSICTCYGTVCEGQRTACREGFSPPPRGFQVLNSSQQEPLSPEPEPYQQHRYLVKTWKLKHTQRSGLYRLSLFSLCRSRGITALILGFKALRLACQSAPKEQSPQLYF